MKSLSHSFFGRKNSSNEMASFRIPTEKLDFTIFRKCRWTNENASFWIPTKKVHFPFWTKFPHPIFLFRKFSPSNQNALFWIPTKINISFFIIAGIRNEAFWLVHLPLSNYGKSMFSVGKFRVFVGIFGKNENTSIIDENFKDLYAHRWKFIRVRAQVDAHEGRSTLKVGVQI